MQNTPEALSLLEDEAEEVKNVLEIIIKTCLDLGVKEKIPVQSARLFFVDYGTKLREIKRIIPVKVEEQRKDDTAVIALTAISAVFLALGQKGHFNLSNGPNYLLQYGEMVRDLSQQINTRYNNMIIADYKNSIENG